MCGIGAVATFGTGMAHDHARPIIDGMLAQLHHRGPDETSSRIESEVAFAFARLSLVGISNGSQPLSTVEDDLVLVANGEVYNHRELEQRLGVNGAMRTDSDCEVLLHQYRRHGLGFLDDVRGMFAIILWDRKKQKLILARDRFGIKPLYYHRNDSRVIAASEIKALMVDAGTPREVDWERALGAQDLTGVPEFSEAPTCTWFKSIDTVPAATILEVDLTDGGFTSHQYWSLPEPNDDWTEERFVDEYRDALATAVRDCATADAELGLFLSGGIDSAAVLALAGSTEIHTFSAVTAGTLLNGDVDASAWAAGKYGNPHHQVEFADDLTPSPDQWKRLLWLTETPLCGPEIYYKYELHRYARAARPELRGMLLGAASDEFNGGYTVQISGESDWNDFQRKITYLADRTDSGRSPASSWRTDYSLPLVKESFLRRGAEVDTYRRYLQSEYRKVQQYNVWHDDRTAAGSSTEARVPFLDHRVVEISASVPVRLRPNLLWDKAILRRAMEGVLPDRVRQRAKGPFFYGAGSQHTYRMMMRMLAAEGGALVDQALAAPGAGDYLEAQNIRTTLSQVDVHGSTANHAELVLRLVNLGLLADLSKSLPQVSAMPAGELQPMVGSDVRANEMAARVGVIIAPSDLPTGRYELGAGVLLTTQPADGSGYLIKHGELLYEFESDSPTLAVLYRLGEGSELAATLEQWPADVIDDVRTDLLQLHIEGLINAAPITVG